MITECGLHPTKNRLWEWECARITHPEILVYGKTALFQPIVHLLLIGISNSINFNTGFDLMFKSWIQIWTGSTGKHAICTQTGMVHQETCKKYCMFRNNIACYMCEQRCSNLTCSMIWFFLNIWYANLCFMDDLYTKMMGIGSLIIELSNMQLIHLKGDRKREKHVFSVQHAVQRVQSKTSMKIR